MAPHDFAVEPMWNHCGTTCGTSNLPSKSAVEPIWNVCGTSCGTSFVPSNYGVEPSTPGLGYIIYIQGGVGAPEPGIDSHNIANRFCSKGRVG